MADRVLLSSNERLIHFWSKKLIVISGSWRVELVPAVVRCAPMPSEFLPQKHNLISIKGRYFDLRSCIRWLSTRHCSSYRVILKKVAVDIFRIILVSEEENDYYRKQRQRAISEQVSWNLVFVKIIKIRHLKGHISQMDHDLKIILRQK